MYFYFMFQFCYCNCLLVEVLLLQTSLWGFYDLQSVTPHIWLQPLSSQRDRSFGKYKKKWVAQCDMCYGNDKN